MKKILLTIFFILIIPISVTGKEVPVSKALSSVENNLFGYDYRNESDLSRLERIEEQLYGKKKTGDIKTRINDIKNDTGITESINNQKVKESKDAQINPIPIKRENKKDNKERYNPAIKEDSTVEYPMVDKLEKTVFNTTYKQDNIYTRLDRLEEKVFTKKSNADLNERVDKLAEAIQPKMRRNSRNQTYTAKELDSYYSNSGLEPINSQSIPFQLAALEQDLLKNDYMDDNTSKRLSRLETKLFNRTFINDNDTTRLQRIMVAYDAKKQSHLYENNRKMQNMATMTQLGGILLMILAILL